MRALFKEIKYQGTLQYKKETSICRRFIPSLASNEDSTTQRGVTSKMASMVGSALDTIGRSFQNALAKRFLGDSEMEAYMILFIIQKMKEKPLDVSRSLSFKRAFNQLPASIAQVLKPYITPKSSTNSENDSDWELV